ncbi:MAG: hypothetical protein AAF467_01430 [Actinomycetota bacterium]
MAEDPTGATMGRERGGSLIGRLGRAVGVWIVLAVALIYIVVVVGEAAVAAVRNWREVLAWVVGLGAVAVVWVVGARIPLVRSVASRVAGFLTALVFGAYGFGLAMVGAFVLTRWLADQRIWLIGPALVIWGIGLSTIIEPLADGRKRPAMTRSLFTGQFPFLVTAGLFCLWIVLVSAGFFTTLAWLFVRNGWAAFDTAPAEIDPVYAWFLWHAVSALPMIADPAAIGWPEPLGGGDRALAWMAIVHVTLVLFVVFPTLAHAWNHRPTNGASAETGEDAGSEVDLTPWWLRISRHRVGRLVDWLGRRLGRESSAP